MSALPSCDRPSDPHPSIWRLALYRLRDWHARGLLRALDDPDGRQLQHRPRRSPRPQGPERRGEGAGRHGHPAVLRQPPPHLFPGLLMTHALTPEPAARFAAIALGHVTRDSPPKLAHVMNVPQDVHRTRALPPTFFSRFDRPTC